MNVGILTGGGDCPGLNAAIRGIVRKGEREYGHTLLGFQDGWRSVMTGEYTELSVNYMRGTLPPDDDGAFGQMVALQTNKVIRVPISDAVADLKYVNDEIWDIAKQFLP